MPCPICAKPTNPEYRPFCSRRCADVDLAHWMRGDYRVPTDEAPDPTDPALRRGDDQE
jgi:endogenous inhibitor of DNA gyrase (YacG/DUF329 family)